MPRLRQNLTQGAARAELIQDRKQQKVARRRVQNNSQDAQAPASTDRGIDHATSSRGDFKANSEINSPSGVAIDGNFNSIDKRGDVSGGQSHEGLGHLKSSSAASGDSTASLSPNSPTTVASATDYPSQPPPGDIFCLDGILRTQFEVGSARPRLDTPRVSQKMHITTSKAPSTSTDEAKKGVSFLANSIPFFARLLSGVNSLRLSEANRARLSRWLRDLQLTARGRRLGIKTGKGLLRLLEIISRAVAVAGCSVARTAAQAMLIHLHAVKDRLSTAFLPASTVQQGIHEDCDEPAEPLLPDPRMWRNYRKDDFENATFASEHPRFGFQPGNDKKHPHSVFRDITWLPSLTPAQNFQRVAEFRSQLEDLGVVREVPCDFYVCFEVIPFCVHAVFRGPWANIDGKICLQNDAWDATNLSITVPAESGRPERPYGDKGPPTPCSPLHFFHRPGQSLKYRP